MQKLDLLSLRPDIPNLHSRPDQSGEEQFQQVVLRPLLKLHNDRFVVLFRHYLHQRKQQWDKKSHKARLAYIEHALKTDQRLQERLLGLLLGWLTDEEVERYFTMEKEINRRLRTLLIQRLQDQMVLT